jgi:hypothetical protein
MPRLWEAEDQGMRQSMPRLWEAEDQGMRQSEIVAELKEELSKETLFTDVRTEGRKENEGLCWWKGKGEAKTMRFLFCKELWS